MSHEFLECNCSRDTFFPNGFISWYETFYEVVDKISYELTTDIGEACRALKDIQDDQGRCGLYELAKELTDKFELQNKDREWDGEFFDEIDKFLEKELYEEN